VTPEREQRERLGAYVLGALASAERHEVEAHLAACRECREEVARLSSLPPLLGRLSAAEARGGTLLPPSALAGRVLAGAEAAAGRLRRQVRRLRVAAAAAAVVALAAVGLVVTGTDGEPRLDPPIVARVVPVAADAAATEGTAAAFAWEWGTTVELDVSSLPARDTYVVWTLDDAGRPEQVGTWGPTAAHAARVRSASSIQRDELSRVEVRDRDGTVLFAFDF
jgi:anti-sigma factor RsiW